MAVATVKTKGSRRTPTTVAAQPQSDPHSSVPAGFAFTSNWRPVHSYLLLTVLTALTLLPFSSKAFHVDDTLFVFAAKHIAKHPLDPYGFDLVWNVSLQRMSDVTENPPLACYYAALAGSATGWSERSLHLAFLLPAIALILGTYRLARRCTKFPLVAALAVLLTPGVLVSATSVMCDTLMLALWVWATVLWIEGLEPLKPSYLVLSAFLISASALTKYFGAALIPLLLVYTIIRLRRLGWWAAYFLIPILSLVGYEMWTAQLYGHGLISGAADFAAGQREAQQRSLLTHVFVSLSFAGGCAVTAFTLLPILWSWKKIVAGALTSALAAAALIFGWIDFGARVGGGIALESIRQHGVLLTVQLAACILAGCSILALAIADLWAHKKHAESWLLALWVLGTWFFAGFVNWTVNARSILPLIPAVGILMLRRLDSLPRGFSARRTVAIAAIGLAVTGLLSIAITADDVKWANSVRDAANHINATTRQQPGTKYFAGHWGFQYYMESLGFVPADQENAPFAAGDIMIVPMNNTEIIQPPSRFDFFELEKFDTVQSNFGTTMSSELGAGFYSDYWGPLPFVFGPVPHDQYEVLLLVAKQAK